MKKSILIGISIVTVLGILLATAELGFADANTKFNAFTDATANEQLTEEAIQATSTLAPVSAQEKIAQTVISEAQAKVSFKILQPAYIPEGYTLNIPQISGTKFRGVSVELEQAIIPYTNGGETLILKELLTIKDDTIDPKNITIPKDTREIIDIDGVEGRFSVEPNGVKYLNWKVGELSLNIVSSTYNSNNITGSSLSKDEMVKIARSVR